MSRPEKELARQVTALREEVRQLRDAFGGTEQSTQLPGEDAVVEMLVDQATELADERDNLVRELQQAREQLADAEQKAERNQIDSS